MRHILALPFLFVALGGSAQAAERTFPAGDFHRIASSGTPHVIVTVGPTVSVRAVGEVAADLERLSIAVADGELKIGIWPDPGYNGGRRTVTVHVTVPSLDGASLTGAGNISIDRIAGPAFLGSVSGAGNIEIGALKADRARLSVSGSGNMRAAGTVGQIDVQVSGSGIADLRGLDGGDAHLSVSGSGNTELGSARTADIVGSGSGGVSVGGRPHCTVHTTGFGEISCR